MNILVLCTRVPYTFRKTGDFRLHQTLLCLKEKHNVKVACFDKENLKEYSEKHNIDTEWLKGYKLGEKIKRNFLFKGQSLILGSYYRMVDTGKLDKIIKEFSPDCIVFKGVGFYDYVKKYESVKKIFSIDDCLYMYYARLSSVYSFIKRKLYTMESQRIMAKEKKAFIRSDAIWFGAYSDMNNVNSQLQLITPGYYLPGYAEEFVFKPLPDNHHIIIYGDFNAKSGILMYSYFIKNIHGALKAKFSDYKVYVVGNINPKMYKDSSILFCSDFTDEILNDARMYLSCYKFRTNQFYPEIVCASHGIPIGGCDKGIGFINVKDKKDYCASVMRRRDLRAHILDVIDNTNALEKRRKNTFEFVKENCNKELFAKNMAVCLEKL